MEDFEFKISLDFSVNLLKGKNVMISSSIVWGFTFNKKLKRNDTIFVIGQRKEVYTKEETTQFWATFFHQ